MKKPKKRKKPLREEYEMPEEEKICIEWGNCIKRKNVDKGIGRLIKRLNRNGIETLESCSGLKEDHPKGTLQAETKYERRPYLCFEKWLPNGEPHERFFNCMEDNTKPFSNYSIFHSESDYMCIQPKSSERDIDLKRRWRIIERTLLNCATVNDIFREDEL